MLQIPDQVNQYCLRAPAHRYWQGERCVYYFALDLQSLDGLLPQRVDEDMVREANRRLTLSHSKAIQDYLRRQNDWLLGAMLLGISPRAVEFEPYRDETGRPNIINFGELRILANQRNTMRIFDGQHRRRAIGDLLLELAESEESYRERAAELLQASVPIALYAEDDLRSLKQMFADAAQTKRIEASTLTIFDRRNAINLAAKYLAENSHLFSGRIEMERTTVAPSSLTILAINQLASCLKILEVGSRGRVSRERNEEYREDLAPLYSRCLSWADEFLPAAREEYAGLAKGAVDNNEIPALRRSSLAFSVTFIRILAGAYHQWIQGGNKGWKPLAEYVRKANLTPRSGPGALLVDAGAMAPGDASPVARRQEVQAAINYIVAQAQKSPRPNA